MDLAVVPLFRPPKKSFDWLITMVSPWIIQITGNYNTAVDLTMHCEHKSKHLQYAQTTSEYSYFQRVATEFIDMLSSSRCHLRPEAERQQNLIATISQHCVSPAPKWRELLKRHIQQFVYMFSQIIIITTIITSQAFSSLWNSTSSLHLHLPDEAFVGRVQNKGGQEGSDPSKSMRDPCKVIMCRPCRDPGWVPQTPLIVNCIRCMIRTWLITVYF